MTRVVTVLAVAGAALLVGSASTSVKAPDNLQAAELVAARFVNGFEGFSYQHPLGNRNLAALTTPALAARLRSSSQAAAGPELTAERFVASARVSGFGVEDVTASGVRLLAQTTEHISTTHGSTTTVRLVPVSLTNTAAGWRVADISGIQGLTHQAPGGPTHGPGAPSVVASTAPPGPVTVSEVQDVGGIPANYLAWMQAAVAAECPGLPWEVLAGIGKVESDFGASTLPGVASGSNAEGAEGPMQFEPATFRAYATVAPGGAVPASPYDGGDAVYSAARMLCADGGGTPGLLDAAIFAYNHSDAYVAMVLAYASAYEQGTGGSVELTSASAPARGIALGSVVVADAEAYLGTPYVWGGERPGVGFDCSGLVQWVYAEAGISLPRVAQDQYDAGPHLPAGATLYPGDLVFFGSGPDAVEHVGIYVGNGEMIDAPYTGVDVRFDHIASVSLGFVGATRPEIPNLSTGAGVPVFSSETADLLSDTSTSSSGSSRSGAPERGPSTRGPATAVGAPTTVPHHSHANKHTPASEGTTTSTSPPRRHGKGTAPTTTSSIPIIIRVPTTTSVPVTTTTRPARRNPPTTTTQPSPTTTQPPPVRTPPSTVPPSTTTTTSPPPTTIATLPPAATTPSPPPHRHHG